MKEYAVLGENKLGDWKVIRVCENEDDARSAVQEAWKTTDSYGYCIYHAVQVFERYTA